MENLDRGVRAYISERKAEEGRGLNELMFMIYLNLIFPNSFYTAVGHLVGDSLSEELNNDNGKTEVSNRFISTRNQLSKLS